jgi:hypothetical protein
VGHKVAIVVVLILQVTSQQGKVFGFFPGDAQPVLVIGVWHVRKAPDRIQRQIDRVELNVGNRMDQRAMALGGERRAPGYLLRMHQFRLCRAAGWRRVDQVHVAVQGCTTFGIQCQCGYNLQVGVGLAKSLKGTVSEFHPYNSRHCRAQAPPSTDWDIHGNL